MGGREGEREGGSLYSQASVAITCCPTRGMFRLTGQGHPIPSSIESLMNHQTYHHIVAVTGL